MSEPTGVSDPFVIRVRALLECRVRVTVDGTALDWRALDGDDEILARPRREMLIETENAEALAITSNGQPIPVPPRTGAFRLTSETLFAVPLLDRR